MNGAFAYENEDEDEDEVDWLQSHKDQFSEKKPSPKIPQPMARGPRPIFVGKIKQICPSCMDEAAIELFRDAKCLACQIANYYDD